MLVQMLLEFFRRERGAGAFDPWLRRRPRCPAIQEHPGKCFVQLLLDFFWREFRGRLGRLGELRGKVGDGVNQAAGLISATVSIPSLNFIPLTTFGNWF